MTTGEQLKLQALDHFEVTAADYLRIARSLATTICKQRGEVTSDDIQEIMPVPAGIHWNVTGAIFRTGFRRIRYQPTLRPTGHSRVISVWRLA